MFCFATFGPGTELDNPNAKRADHFVIVYGTVNDYAKIIKYHMPGLNWTQEGCANQETGAEKDLERDQVQCANFP